MEYIIISFLLVIASVAIAFSVYFRSKYDRMFELSEDVLDLNDDIINQNVEFLEKNQALSDLVVDLRLEVDDYKNLVDDMLDSPASKKSLKSLKPTKTTKTTKTKKPTKK